jgi:uncharacterized protein
MNVSTLTIRLQPRSSKSMISRTGEVVKVWVSEPPVDGQANLALIELLSDKIGLAKQNIEIIRGHSSRTKTIRFTGLSDTELNEKISA